MTLTGTRNYVGFGFGAIQAGLFLYEAYRSGNFEQLTVAEVMPDVVKSVRQAGGWFRLNIAHLNGIEHAQIGPIQIENPAVEADRMRLVQAVAAASEIGTAVPSISYYRSDAKESLHLVLAEGLRWKVILGERRAVVYTAENNNYAAETLEALVMEAIPSAERDAVAARVRFLNTVIGKMSGVVTDGDEIASQGLINITSGNRRAYLIEAFNRIQISRIHFDGPQFERGIDVFEEKDDLIPFEEAKLYGHNASHALAAYLGAFRQVRWIADLRTIPGGMDFLRGALIEESGTALMRKYAGLDAMFTAAGYQAYADELIERMMNPHLRDTVERVGRDLPRKLGWDDRLIGTLRLALEQGVEPRRYALASAVALSLLDGQVLEGEHSAADVLTGLWSTVERSAESEAQVLQWIEGGLRDLRGWVAAGYPDLEAFIQQG